MTLTLPAIRRRPIRDMAKQDPYGPVRVANARAAALSEWGKAGKAAFSLYKTYQDREDREDVIRARRKVRDADAMFRADYEGQEEYDPLVVEDEAFFETAQSAGIDELDAPVPKYSVYADWRSNRYNSTVRQAAKGIRNPRLREEFIQDQDTQRKEFYARDSAQAAKEQIAHNTRVTMRRVEDFVLAKQFDEAENEIRGAQLPKETEEKALWDLSKRKQVDYFSETLERRQLSSMIQAFKELDENEPTRTGRLNAEEHKIYADELRRAIDQENRAIDSAVQASFKLQADDLKNQIDDIWSNRPLTSGRRESMLKNINDLQVKYPVLAREATWTLHNRRKVDDIVWKSRGEDRAALDALKAESDGTEEYAYLVRQTEAALDSKDRLLQTDPIKWARDTKFAAFEPLDGSTPESIGLSLKKRLPGVQSILSEQGAYKGFLDKAEASVLGTIIENQTVEENLRTFGSISGEVGEDFAPSIYEQFKEHGVAGTAAIAGQIMASHPEKKETARKILEGAKLRKENPVVQQWVKDNEVKDTAARKFGTLFAGNPRHQALMVEAFMDICAITKNTDTAFKELVGNTIDLGDGFRIQVPEGVSARAYQRRLEDLPMSYWESDDMRVNEASPQVFREAMIDGTLTQVGIEDGGAILITPAGTTVTKQGKKDAFVFSMDWGAETVSEAMQKDWRRQQEEEAEAKAKQAVQDEAEFLRNNPGAMKIDYDWYLENLRASSGFMDEGE